MILRRDFYATVRIWVCGVKDLRCQAFQMFLNTLIAEDFRRLVARRPPLDFTIYSYLGLLPKSSALTDLSSIIPAKTLRTIGPIFGRDGITRVFQVHTVTTIVEHD